MTHAPLLLEDARRRLKNARRRAAYWSGRPSFRGFGFIPNANSGKCPDSEYELAMDDVESLAAAVERMTGKRVVKTDYRAEFAVRFSQAMKGKQP